MDHYKVLGLSRNASKEEIKKAFRKLAVEFHPDKHGDSPGHVRDAATFKFKQVSEAYETLIDDRKRADYNLRTSSNFRNANPTNSTYRSSYGYGYGYGHTYSRPPERGVDALTKFEMVLRFLTTRTFLLNAALVGALLSATFVIDKGGEALWKMQNSGKSFEEAFESLEKAKAVKDET